MRRTVGFVVATIAILGSVPRQDTTAQGRVEDRGATVDAQGDVLYPGAYPLTPGLTARDLLILAGGSPNDTVHSLILRRNKNVRGGTEEIPFDPNERLRPNDALIVRGVYTLRPDEVLQIDVAGRPEISGRYIVQDDKTVILPMGERVSVGHDTEFRRNIAQIVSSKLPGTPRVEVCVAKPRGPRGEGDRCAR